MKLLRYIAAGIGIVSIILLSLAFIFVVGAIGYHIGGTFLGIVWTVLALGVVVGFLAWVME